MRLPRNLREALWIVWRVVMRLRRRHDKEDE